MNERERERESLGDALAFASKLEDEIGGFLFEYQRKSQSCWSLCIHSGSL